MWTLELRWVKFSVKLGPRVEWNSMRWFVRSDFHWCNNIKLNIETYRNTSPTKCTNQFVKRYCFLMPLCLFNWNFGLCTEIHLSQRYEKGEILSKNMPFNRFASFVILQNNTHETLNYGKFGAYQNFCCEYLTKCNFLCIISQILIRSNCKTEIIYTPLSFFKLR